MARGGADPALVKGLSLMAAVFFSCLGLSTCQINITQVLEPYPNFSLLSQGFTSTGVDAEINNRTSITILAPNNSVLQGYLNTTSDPNTIADTLRYHVLLTYYGVTELDTLNANGTTVTTLLQTTGRANGTQGLVNLYKTGTSYLVGHTLPDTNGTTTTILGNITQSFYVYSVLEVSAVLVPAPVTPALPSPAPAPSPVSLAPPPNATTVPPGPA